MDRLDGAEKEFINVLQSKIDEPASYVNLGIIYLKKGQYRQAEQHFKQAVEKNRSFAEGYYNLGLVYVSTNRRSQAVEAFEKALFYKPQLEQAELNLMKLK